MGNFLTGYNDTTLVYITIQWIVEKLRFVYQFINSNVNESSNLNAYNKIKTKYNHILKIYPKSVYNNYLPGSMDGKTYFSEGKKSLEVVMNEKYVNGPYHTIVEMWQFEKDAIQSLYDSALQLHKTYISI
jgi:hypothetical protein